MKKYGRFVSHRLIFLSFFLPFFILNFSFLISCENPLIQRIVEPKEVSFESNGGSRVESQTVFKDKPVKRPPDPSKDGCNFIAWYIDDETFLEEWDFDAIPSADMTLYAKWIAIVMIPITDVDITITQPETDAVPNTTASGTGNFTIGTVSWDPNDNPFLAGEVYTATVTLTARQGYAFASDLNTATINGKDATVVNNTQSALTLSHEFQPTRTVTGMTVTTQPAKMTYTHGDALDLSGLVVTFVYNIGSPEEVAFGDFGSRSITTYPDNGATLVHLTHNGTNVTVIKGSFTDTTDPLIVNSKNITFNVDPIPDREYTGYAHEPTVIVRDGTTELTLTDDYTVVYSDNIVAGTATVAITGAGNYTGSTGSTTFTITKKVSSIAVTKQPTSMTYTHGDELDLSGIEVRFTYDDGSYDDVEFDDFETRGLTTAPEDGDVLSRSTHNNTPVTITYNNNSNITAATNPLTVNPKNITFAVDTIPAQEYTGDDLEPAVTVKDGTIILTRNTDYTVTYSNNLIAGTAAVTINGIGNYAGSTGSATFVITNKVDGIAVSTPPTKLIYTHGEELDLSGIEIRFNYNDGSFEDVELDDFESRNITTVPEDGAMLSHSTNDGTTTVTITYNSFTAATSLTVNKKALTIATATHSKTYDGTTDATGVTVTLSGKVGADDVDAGAVTAVYTNANAGTTTVNITDVTPIGAAAGNYTVTAENGITVAGITRKNVTITPDAGQSKVYNTADPAFTYTYSPALVASHTSFTGALGRAGGEDAGTYAFTLGNLAVDDGNSGNNYSLTLSGSNVFTINKANPTVTTPPTATPITYGDTLSTSNLSGGVASVGGTNVPGSFTWTNDATIPTVSNGGYEVTFTPTDDTNYNTATATVDITVNPKALTITGLSTANKTYDGNTTATVTGTAVITGRVGNDDVTVTAGTAAFGDKNVGDGKTVTFSGYSLSGTAAGNYSLTAQPANTTANITRLQLTIAAPIGTPTKTYNGNTNYTGSGITLGTLTNKVNGDTVNVTIASATYNAASVAGANQITIVYSISGDGAGNYTAPVNSTIAATITRADGAVVSPPTVNGTPTLNSITLTAITITANTEQTVEYSRSNAGSNTTNGAWQEERTFSGLAAGTTYYFFARSKESANYNAGNSSAGTPIATTQQQGITVTLDVNDFLDKAPNFDSTKIISRGGTGYSTTDSVTINGAFQSIYWEIPGVGVYSGQTVSGTSTTTPVTIPLNALEPIYNSLGWHTVTVTVTIGGKQYMNSFRFQIVN